MALPDLEALIVPLLKLFIDSIRAIYSSWIASWTKSRVEFTNIEGLMQLGNPSADATSLFLSARKLVRRIPRLRSRSGAKQLRKGLCRVTYESNAN